MEEQYTTIAGLYNQIIPGPSQTISGTSGTSTSYHGRYTYPHTPPRFDFQSASNLFDLNLTSDQILMLDELFNSIDESNRIVAREMFKTILIRKLKEELKEII